MKKIQIELPKLNSMDSNMDSNFDNSTKLRYILNETLHTLKKLKFINNDLLDDLTFIIFDYLDNFENNIYENKIGEKYEHL